MTNLTQKYLDKELADSIPEKLPEDYDEWLIKQEPSVEQLDIMAKAFEGMQEAVDKFFSHPLFNRPPF